MKRLLQWAFYSAAVLLPAACGCKRDAGADQQQAVPPVLLKSFVLYDVQGLFGGRALWAGEDRVAVVQFVGPPPAGQSGLWEKRYRLKLSADQWAEVERLVGAHPLRPSKAPSRPGVPDEARPSIMVVTRAGMIRKAQKWANDKDSEFDPLYEYLLGACRADGEPVREGPYDWNWRPEGFDQPW